MSYYGYLILDNCYEVDGNLYLDSSQLNLDPFDQGTIRYIGLQMGIRCF